MARENQRINEVTLLGINFIRWGLGLFIFGLIIGYAPFVHFLLGNLENNGSLKNVMLWLGCPYAVQIGALGMVALGAVYGLLPANKLEAESRDYTSLWLCVIGLLTIFVIGFVGYYGLNTHWPSYNARSENLWLIALGLSAAVYLIGVALAYLSILHVTDHKFRHS
jgi:hypothetical protein